MNTEQKVFIIETNGQVDQSFPLNGEIQWPGGDGWIDVSGSFNGATALVNVFISIEGVAQYAGSQTGAGLMLPDFPSGISSSGIFKFSSPPGLLRFLSPTITPGDYITNLNIRAIRLDSYKTGH